MKKISVMGRNFTLEETLDEMNSSWGLNHLIRVKNNFCQNICKGKSCIHCDKCAIQQCFDFSVKEIKNGNRKDLIPCAEMLKNNSKFNYGAKRYYNKKGVTTEVWHL